MSLADIRAHIESRVNTAFGNLSPPVEVVFDNVQETPPALPYVVVSISFTDTRCQRCAPLTERWSRSTATCRSRPMPTRGMKALEQYATTSWL